MAFKIFNIGKANEEITRLESEVARLNSELSSVKDNATALENSAQEASTNLTAAQTEITNLKSTLAQKDSELATVTTSLETMTGERDTLKATIEKPDGEIAKQSALKAQEIVAAQGAQVVPLKDAETPNQDPSRSEVKKLSGIEKAIAAHKLSKKTRE